MNEIVLVGLFVYCVITACIYFLILDTAKRGSRYIEAIALKAEVESQVREQGGRTMVKMFRGLDDEDKLEVLLAFFCTQPSTSLGSEVNRLFRNILFRKAERKLNLMLREGEINDLMRRKAIADFMRWRDTC